jgi:L-iditol 2-dehydrogenase
MKAARLHAARDIRIEEVPTPQPGPGEVLVRVRAVSICASDWRLYSDGHAGGKALDRPIIQGHEFAGDVVALGPGVDTPAIGTRVAVEPSWHCGHCDMCLRGSQHVCRNILFPSFPPTDGALAGYIACPAHATAPLPDGVGYIEGALAEPLGVAMHAVRLVPVSVDDRVIVLGAGVIGICTAMLLRRQGVTDVLMVEPVAGRRELAARLGAAEVASDACELAAAGREGDIVFECSGHNAAPEQTMRLATPQGRIIIVGIPQPEQVTLDFSVPRRRELTVVFSRRSRGTLPETLSLIAGGEIDLKRLPTRQFALPQAAEAMELTGAQSGDVLRAVVLP